MLIRSNVLAWGVMRQVECMICMLGNTCTRHYHCISYAGVKYLVPVVRVLCIVKQFVEITRPEFREKIMARVACRTMYNTVPCTLYQEPGTHECDLKLMMVRAPDLVMSDAYMYAYELRTPHGKHTYIELLAP
jgi:hypothetical protein